MTEILHPATLTDDYGNTWAQQSDGTYSSAPYTGWTLDEVRRVFGVPARQTPEIVRVPHEHVWVSIPKLGDPYSRAWCHCGAVETEGRP